MKVRVEIIAENYQEECTVELIRHAVSPEERCGAIPKVSQGNLFTFSFDGIERAVGVMDGIRKVLMVLP